jgi:hypothetical protein
MKFRVTNSVSEEKANASIPSPFIALSLPILFALNFQYGFHWKNSIQLCAVIVLLSHFYLSKTQRLEAVVTVFPACVQLARLQGSKPIETPLLIPREDILDIIVNEIILSHKVVSVVVFRVLKRQGCLKCTSTVKFAGMGSLLQEGMVHLITAFPGVEMTYRECLVISKKISESLGLD